MAENEEGVKMPEVSESLVAASDLSQPIVKLTKVKTKEETTSNSSSPTKLSLTSTETHQTIMVMDESKGQEQQVVIIKLKSEDTNRAGVAALNSHVPLVTEEDDLPTESGSETESQESKDVNGTEGEEEEEVDDEEAEVEEEEGVLSFMQAKARGDVDQWVKYLDETDPCHRLRSLCKKGDLAALQETLEANNPEMDVNAVSEDGWTCLHEIITHECQFTEVARILLKFGANVNTQDFHGDSPLHSTLLYHNSDNIRLLLDHGADLALVNGVGRMPIHVVDEAESLKLLLDYKAKPSAKDRVGNTPLHYAVLAKDKERIRVLLEYNADVNVQNQAGSSPLHMTAGDSDLAQMLLEAGANPNLKDINGNTALHIASRGRHKEIVKLLLDRNADSSLVNNAGKTSLNLAKDREMKQILLGKKATSVSPVPVITTINTTSVGVCKKDKKNNNSVLEQLIAKLIPKCNSPGILKRRRSSCQDVPSESPVPVEELTPDGKRRKGPRLTFSEVNDYSGVEVVEDQKRVRAKPMYNELQFSSDDD